MLGLGVCVQSRNNVSNTTVASMLSGLVPDYRC